MRRTSLAFLCTALLAACGAAGGRGGGGGGGGNDLDGSSSAHPDLAMGRGTDGAIPPVDYDGGGTQGCSELSGCYTVYAHSDHILYKVDLANQMLLEVGPFHAPMVNGKEDSITDLAVAPDDTIYVISKTNLYTASASNGQVTPLGPITGCGTYAVALTFTPDGNLYAGDHQGAFCEVDLSAKPPTMRKIATLSNNLALAGDLVAVADGTMYATVYDQTNTKTASNNILAKIDPKTGAVTEIGPTGFPRLFGTAYDQGKVFGFTGDGSGDVVTIDPKTGVGTLYGKFNDPTTGMGISFGGAGVNSKVAPMIM